MNRRQAVATENGRGTASAQRSQVHDSVSKIAKRGRGALLLLLEAYQYSQELQRSVWDFAVEIESLHEQGLTGSDFRWLVCKGLLDHAREATPSGDDMRTFRHGGRLTFGKKTCFVLTDAGIEFVLTSLSQSLQNGHAPPESHGSDDVASAPEVPLNPLWDRDRQQLRFGDLIVKQFKVPAPNQELILAAFQEDGWPVRIDDPLPPHPELDPKRRLHDTINSLNRNQKNYLIRFLGDGSGQGVRWDFCRRNASEHSGNGYTTSRNSRAPS